MDGSCPACGAALGHPAEDGGSCAECGHMWAPVAGESGGEAIPFEFELQYALGDPILGPFDRTWLRQRIYEGLLTGDERVRAPGGGFERLGDRAEFADVIDLALRRPPPPRSIGPRAKQAHPGWAPVEGPVSAAPGPAEPEPGPPAEDAAAPSLPIHVPTDRPSGVRRLVVAGIVLLVVLGLLVAVAGTLLLGFIRG